MAWNKGVSKHPAVWSECHRCKTSFQLGRDQAYKYRKSAAAGTLAGTHFYCCDSCLRGVVSEGLYAGDSRCPAVRWHCQHCRESFQMTMAQAYKYRKYEAEGTLGRRRFYCSDPCKRAGMADLYRTGEARCAGGNNQRDSLSLSRMEAYWKTVEDPDYYIGNRYESGSPGSPLSFQERGQRIAKSTGSFRA
jgi:hypothetical protein